MEFEKRLQKAIQRGQKRSVERSREAHAKALTEDELKSLHTQYRLQLSEHIESCLEQLPQHFPGFRYETIVGERGWGAACWRDDVGAEQGSRRNFYSRLEMTVRPFSSYHVLDLAAKGTIRNKEVYNRNYFEELSDADPEKFIELVDVWVLEYAELFAAQD